MRLRRPLDSEGSYTLVPPAFLYLPRLREPFGNTDPFQDKELSPWRETYWKTRKCGVAWVTLLPFPPHSQKGLQAH